jgi:hypothetical protein
MSAKKKSPKRAAKRPAKTAKKKAAPKRKAKKVVRAAARRPAKKRAKKAAPRKATVKAKPKTKTKTALRRRDGSGHLDPKYAADLRARSRETPRDETSGFFEDPRTQDDLAEVLGEEFIGGATSGEGAGEDVANQEVPEEVGGPFVVTSANTEFAEGTDESNPKGSRREPFPRT